MEVGPEGQEELAKKTGGIRGQKATKGRGWNEGSMRRGQGTACQVSAAETRVRGGVEDTAGVESKDLTVNLAEELGLQPEGDESLQEP